MTPPLSKPKVLWVGPSNLGPYHLARYNALAAAGWDVHVALCPISEHHRPWKFSPTKANFSIHQPFTESGEHFGVTSAKNVASFLKDLNPSIVISIGYSSPFVSLFGAQSRLLKIPRMVNLIGNPASFVPHTTSLKEIAKWMICRSLYPAALVPGSRARTLANEVGISDDRIWEVGNVIDVEHFSSTSPRSGEENSFLYVGRLSTEKNLFRLLDAFRAYRAQGGRWNLIIGGDGPMRSTLEDMAVQIPGATLLGWVDYKELPALFQRVGAFVLPSTYEPWGLVLNEAMASGLPILVSRNCGAYPELCRDGTNGLSFSPTNIESLAEIMTHISMLSSQRRAAMGAASKKIISSYSWSEWTSGVSIAIDVEIQRQTSGIL